MTDKSKKFCFQPSLVKELGLRSGYAARRREIGWLDQQISNSRRGGAIDAQYRAIRLLVFRWFRAGLVGWPLQPALNSQRSLRVFSTTMAPSPQNRDFGLRLVSALPFGSVLLVRFSCRALAAAQRIPSSEIGRLLFPRKRTSCIQKSAGPVQRCRLVQFAKETSAIRISDIAVVQSALMRGRDDVAVA